MPKYYDFKICGYYLYFTAHCIIECMHVHASDRKLTEGGSAKFFVKSNGDTVIQNRGVLTDRELSKIQSFIKDNYKEMYLKWASMSENGFFGENKRFLWRELMQNLIQQGLLHRTTCSSPCCFFT